MSKSMPNPDELIAQYLEENPERPSPADARLKDYGTAVWALLSYLQLAVGDNVEQAAADYGVPVDTVEAAQAYYRQSPEHKRVIDARVTLHAA
jgi:uncharacterized protein (DUF433 family)